MPSFGRMGLRELIGDTCILCHEVSNPKNRRKPKKPDNIIFHEIHWKEHSHTRSYYYDHPKDFVPVCRECHRMIHILHNKFGFELEEITKFIIGKSYI